MKKLKATHAMIRFTVQGSGDFPIDMLRYDGCCPDTESDAHVLSESAFREVTLRRYAPVPSATAGEPTHGRWRSFGWTVVAVDGVSVQ